MKPFVVRVKCKALGALEERGNKPMEENQMSRFITYLRERLKTEQPATEDQVQLNPSDTALMEQFMELTGKAEHGRVEREADQQYQTELQAALQLFRGPKPSSPGMSTTQ